MNRPLLRQTRVNMFLLRILLSPEPGGMPVLINYYGLEPIINQMLKINPKWYLMAPYSWSEPEYRLSEQEIPYLIDIWIEQLQSEGRCWNRYRKVIQKLQQYRFKHWEI